MCWLFTQMELRVREDDGYLPDVRTAEKNHFAPKSIWQA
jgi:hypothetical protein